MTEPFSYLALSQVGVPTVVRLVDCFFLARLIDGVVGWLVGLVCFGWLDRIAWIGWFACTAPRVVMGVSSGGCQQGAGGRSSCLLGRVRLGGKGVDGLSGFQE